MPKPSACASCGKRLSKKQWYYRNGQHYCNQRCWETAKAKALADGVKKAEETAAAAKKAEEAAAAAKADAAKPAPEAPAAS